MRFVASADDLKSQPSVKIDRSLHVANSKGHGTNVLNRHSFDHAADRSLARDAKNLDAMVKDLSDSDSGMRYWAVVGLHLLEGKAASAKAQLEAALKDDEHQVVILAAWTLIKLGHKADAMARLKQLVTGGTNAENALYNTIDWMGDDGLPLVKTYFESEQKRRNQVMSHLAKRYNLKVKAATKKPRNPKKPKKKTKK